MATSDLRGCIFDIQRFSIHDGPGIRTSVFLKGCPLNCRWCHNPEGISGDPALSFLPAKCIGCGYCFRVCPAGAHRMEDGRHALDRERCRTCGACTVECYAGALELIGRDVTVGEALAEVLRDRAFYDTSGGGLTLSGGEPTLQIDFAAALLAAAREERLHTCVETCGHATWQRLERLLPLVDLFLYDFKETDPARHAEFTGVGNALVLENLRALCRRGAKVLLRCPIVPGCNDREEHFQGIAALARELPQLEGVELMPYHRLGLSKLDRLGQARQPLVDQPTPPPEMIRGWIRRMAELGVTVANSPG